MAATARSPDPPATNRERFHDPAWHHPAFSRRHPASGNGLRVPWRASMSTGPQPAACRAGNTARRRNEAAYPHPSRRLPAAVAPSPTPAGIRNPHSHRLWPAGSFLGYFRTPAGARNSSRQRNGFSRLKKASGRSARWDRGLEADPMQTFQNCDRRLQRVKLRLLPYASASQILPALKCLSQPGKDRASARITWVVAWPRPASLFETAPEAGIG